MKVGVALEQERFRLNKPALTGKTFSRRAPGKRREEMLAGNVSIRSRTASHSTCSASAVRPSRLRLNPWIVSPVG